MSTSAEPSIRLVLAIHNHQPVGNFDGVFEESYQNAYLPFLDAMEECPELPFSLHTSGSLMEWIADRHPEYLDRLRERIDAGKLEILGGAFQEPILTMIPHRDRVGQIREYSEYLHDLLGVRPRGAWLAERVWEPQLVSALAEAGIEFTLLDDFHFQRAGLEGGDLLGYYLVEDEGKLIKVFPGDERLRYVIPFDEPHATYERLRTLAHERPGSVVVFGDDGEKFGAWPETYEHVYQRGWFRRFLDMLRGNADWLKVVTFSQALDSTLPLGKIYLPESSYREMTEWVLPQRRQEAYFAALKKFETHPDFPELKPFVRAGGFWRNFRTKYPEADEMYARMILSSNRLAKVESDPDADPDHLAIARRELYRGQCNCSYWHGAFGGLYLPHLRNAVYKALIACESALDDAEGKTGPRVSIESGDWNLDARMEVRLNNDQMDVLVRPARGGHVYGFDVKHAQTNILATLDRRPEPYHAKVLSAVRQSREERESANEGEVNNLQNKVILKQEGLDQLLVYDRHPRKSLADHVYPIDATLDDLRSGRDIELGDFIEGAYLAKLQRSPAKVALAMERPGRCGGDRDLRFHIQKTLTLAAGSDTLSIHYVLDELPDEPIHFAVEFNLAAMAGHAEDRNYYDGRGQRLGPLDSVLDLPASGGISLSDEWLNLSVGLRWSKTAGVWCFPIQTVSQSEGGYESVFQSAAVLPHWIVRGDERRRWEVTIFWSVPPINIDLASSSISSSRGIGLVGSASR